MVTRLMPQWPLRRTRAIHRHLVPRLMSSSGSQDEVLLEKVDTKGVISLNRPRALNALNLPMIRAMYPVLKQWEADPTTSMVIIKGVGDKAFCAGGDVVAIAESGKAGTDVCKQFFKEEYVLNHAIGTLRVPWIALIDGITMGGGVGLSVHGKYRVATERTLFAMPETAIALFPDVGGGYFLPRLPNKLGVYMALTGFRLKGHDVQKAGIATHFVESNFISDLEKELLELKAPMPQAVEQVLQHYHNKSSESAHSEFVLAPHVEDISRLFAGTTVEQIFKDCENDGSEWALKQLKTMKKMSPTSMKVTLEQLRRGGSMTLADVLQMEYRLSQHCMQDKDFFEGIRAVLVDKDQNPQWHPATIEGVTDEKVAWYFEPLSADRELNL